MGLFTQRVRTRRRPGDVPRLSQVRVVETHHAVTRLACPCCRVSFDYGADCPACMEPLVDRLVLHAVAHEGLCACADVAPPTELQRRTGRIAHALAAAVPALIFAFFFVFILLSAMSKMRLI